MWHVKRESCFWTDIHNGLLYEMNWKSQEVTQWDISLPVSLVMENYDGDLVLAVKGGIVKFNIATECFTWLVKMDHEFNNMRCNDGACDINGQLWIDEMDMDCKDGKGAVYHIDKKMTLNKVISKVTIPNGICWSRANDKMYFIDTPTRSVCAYRFDKINGEIEFEKVVINTPEDLGLPDGMNIDAEGMLWIAMYGGSCVLRYNPDNGLLLQSISIPVPHVTNCCFVGKDLDQLMVTTARENLSPTELEKFPQSGDIFIIRDPGVRGLKHHLCKF